MKSNKYSIISVISIIILGIIVVSCNKDSEFSKTISCAKSSQYFAYTGETFELDKNFINKYDVYGYYHNLLVSAIDSVWNDYSNRKLFDYSLQKAQSITGIFIDSLDYGINVPEYSTWLLESSKKDFAKTYIETLTDIFSEYYPDIALRLFINDINKITYEKTDMGEILNDITIVEQKILNSSIDTNGIKLGLCFCSVYKYSLSNIASIIDNPNSNLYPMLASKEKEGAGDAVLADAVGFVKGAWEGGKVGTAGGVQGVILMGAVGGVCYGALSTAVEVGIKKNISKWIDSWF